MPLARINGIELYYEEHGSGFPVVFVAGFTETALTWKPQRQAFASRFRIVTFDPRGHGRTEAPEEPERYSIELFVEDVRSLMDHLGLRRAHVVGHSLGGAIALRFALTHPERVGGLVMVNANSSAGTPEWSKRMMPRMRARAEAVRTGGMAAMANGMISRRLAPDDLAEREREFLGLSTVGIGHTATQVMPFLSSLGRAHELPHPTLLVVGERDRMFVRRSRLLEKRIPNSRRIVISEAGHAAHIDQPDRFNAEVLDFLTRVDGAAR